MTHGTPATLLDGSLAAAILDREPPGAPRLTAVYAARSPADFAGVPGALWSGHG